MTLPHHLFLSASGDLHDTRHPDWATTPLRSRYAFHSTDIQTTADLRAALRAGPYAWPGGYPLYFITNDGCALSFDGVRNDLRECLENLALQNSRRIVALSINYEDEDLVCDITDKPIPSAYGGEE